MPVRSYFSREHTNLGPDKNQLKRIPSAVRMTGSANLLSQPGERDQSANS